MVRPLEEQEDRESQKLWRPTVIALKNRNHDVATEEKTRVEDQQREEAAMRLEQGLEWQPRLFRKVRGGPGGSEEGEEALDWILDADMFVFMFIARKYQNCADCISDGPTPEVKTKKILAVYPIIKGQPQFDPSRAPPPQHKQSQGHPADQEDLIDFGRPDEKLAPAKGLPQNNDVLQNHRVEPPVLQHPPQPDIRPPIVRLDTETNELDQFVDAKP